MPITPVAPFPKSAGDSIRSADWNQAVSEVIRLDNAKLNAAGGQVTGDLAVGGALSVTSATATPKLRVAGGAWDVGGGEGDVRIGNDTHRLKIGVATGGGGAGDVRLRAQGGTNRLILGGGAVDVLTVRDTGVGIGTLEPNRALTVRGAAGTYVNVQASNGAQEVLLGADGAGGIVSVMTNHDLVLRSGGNVNRVVIKNTGRVEVAGGAWDVGGTEGDLRIGDATHRLKIGVALGGGGAGDARLRAHGGTNRLILGGGAQDMLTVRETGVGIGTLEPATRFEVTGGSARFNGPVELPKTGDGFARFTNETFSNESELVANNLKLVMGNAPFLAPGSLPMTYQFAIGHTGWNFVSGGTSFYRRFSIDQAGNLFCSGSKAGYVIDHFVNAVGEAVEVGDVVVLGTRATSRFYGTDNNIPIPEVDLAAEAYDTRVCGIVASVVTEGDVPTVEMDPEEMRRIADELVPEKERRGKSPEELQAAFAAALKKSRKRYRDLDNPLRALGAASDADTRTVGPDQMGRMVTLGAFAHCKVDADIAPIAVGDLLTTSPTRGHAQKVLDPAKGAGAIIGKALGPLKKGRGKIPILVTLH